MRKAFQNSRDDLTDELQAGRPRKSTLDNICQWEALYMRTDSPPTKKCKGNSLHHIRAKGILLVFLPKGDINSAAQYCNTLDRLRGTV